MQLTDEILTRTEELQEDCNKTIKQLFTKVKPKIIGWTALKRLLSGNHNLYENCNSVWMYNKIAELELRIENLENQTK